jgi:photosynthetic reaction center cytochrome c subunit
MKTTALLLGGVATALLATAVIFTPGWNLSKVTTTQTGFRGTMMGELSTAKSRSLLKAANALPDAIDPAEAGGKKATEVYKNVQVLTDLSSAQLDRVMLGLAAWVGGDDGCAYCHNVDNLSDDGKYTKRVARVMLKMTRHINQDWKAHVANTGVTCYTCHRGHPVPKYVWYKGAPPRTGGFSATNDGAGHPDFVNGTTALKTDPFSGFLDGKDTIRVQSDKALPVSFGPSIRSAENTYSLMMAISGSLGVNCTYCHNTRVFRSWTEGSPVRVTAWQGIQMARELNADYLEPLQATFPANRLGPTGDGPKVYCATCHQGAPKPLLGQSMAKNWPELDGVAAK